MDLSSRLFLLKRHWEIQLFPVKKTYLEGYGWISIDKAIQIEADKDEAKRQKRAKQYIELAKLVDAHPEWYLDIPF